VAEEKTARYAEGFNDEQRNFFRLLARALANEYELTADEWRKSRRSVLTTSRACHRSILCMVIDALASALVAPWSGPSTHAAPAVASSRVSRSGWRRACACARRRPAPSLGQPHPSSGTPNGSRNGPKSASGAYSVLTGRQSRCIPPRTGSANSLKRLVPLAGLEPARPCGQQILSPCG